MADIVFLGTSSTDVADWNQSDNWSTGTVPVSTDDVFFNALSAAVGVTTNLDQSAVALTSLTITAGFEGTIGNSSTFLQIGAVDLEIGSDVGNGSQRLNIDLGTTTASTVDIITTTTTTGADENFAPLRLKANNAGTDIQINGETSNVSIIDEDDVTGTIGDITIFNSSTVLVGRGCTYSNFTQINGTTEVLESQGANTVAGGTVTLSGSTAVTSVTQTGGICVSNTTGTTTLYTGRGGTLDTVQSSVARTITTLVKSPNFTILRHINVTITNDNLDSDYDTFEIAVTENL